MAPSASGAFSHWALESARTSLLMTIQERVLKAIVNFYGNPTRGTDADALDAISRMAGLAVAHVEVVLKEWNVERTISGKIVMTDAKLREIEAYVALPVTDAPKARRRRPPSDP